MEKDKDKKYYKVNNRKLRDDKQEERLAGSKKHWQKY